MVHSCGTGYQLPPNGNTAQSQSQDWTPAVPPGGFQGLRRWAETLMDREQTGPAWGEAGDAELARAALDSLFKI